MSSDNGDCNLLEEEEEEDPKLQTTFHVSENAYDMVQFTPRSTQRKMVIRKYGNKKCLVAMCFILLFTLALSVSVGIIAFPLEIIKLTAKINELELMITGGGVQPFLHYPTPIFSLGLLLGYELEWHCDACLL